MNALRFGRFAAERMPPAARNRIGGSPERSTPSDGSPRGFRGARAPHGGEPSLPNRAEMKKEIKKFYYFQNPICGNERIRLEFIIFLTNISVLIII